MCRGGGGEVKTRRLKKLEVSESAAPSGETKGGSQRNIELIYEVTKALLSWKGGGDNQCKFTQDKSERRVSQDRDEDEDKIGGA